MNRKKSLLLKAGIAAVALALLAIAVLAPPSPHSISGTIYHSNAANQVPLGTRFTINETVTGDYRSLVTSLPVPGLSGRYFETINGSDGDLTIITAWNITNWGQDNVTLNGSMSGVNVYLNNSRGPQANVTILLQNNTAFNISSSFNLTARVHMLGADATGCNARIAFSNPSVMSTLQPESELHSLGSIAVNSLVITSWNVSTIQEGNSTITVNATCNAETVKFDNSEIFMTANSTVEDHKNPVVTLALPENNSWGNSTINFTYNASDESGVASCALYIDDVLEDADPEVENNLVNNFTRPGIPEGTRQWYVSCQDASSFLNEGYSTNYTVNVDNTPPTVNLISPADHTVRANNTAPLSYSVSEATGLANCSLFINGVYDLQNTTPVLPDATQNFTRYFPRGSYTWEIGCRDIAGNTGDSGSWHLNITDPDIMVNASGIILSTNTPIETQNVTINATIHNTGDENATNVTVYVLESMAGYAPTLLANFTFNLSAGNSTTVNATLTAEQGTHVISVLADPPVDTNGTIAESNESNNLANTTLFITMWQIYYGNATTSVLLDSGANFSVYRWLGDMNLSGNIFVADSDSAINWSGLIGLGINLSQNRTMDDFAELDASLKTTNSTDSVNATFTLNGEPRNMTSFTVFGRGISNVSISQSTNTTSFVTGILWDASDFASGEYNSSQDVVFISRINVSRNGGYGNYDFEIRVPANLRQYKVPNNDDSVSFYSEII